VTDNITLPREVVEKIREAWSSEVYPPAASIEWYDIMDALRAALDAALAEPEKERAEVAAPARNGVASSMEEIDILTPEVYRTTEPPAKPEPATDEQVVEADENHEPSWIDYRDGWRAAERWHGITKEDKT